MMSSRREFLRRLSFAALPMVLAVRPRQNPPPAPAKPPQSGAGSAADTLAVPLGGTIAAVGPLDNDPGVIAIERKLRCACGCTLDIYTCRTTDFSCTYSPAMHATLVAQVQQGSTPDEIIAWFLAQPDTVYGHKVMLMAPEARGFNLMGYIVPGLTVTAFGLALAAWLLRKRSEPTLAVVAGQAPGAPPPDSEQLEKLRRALDGIES